MYNQRLWLNASTFVLCYRLYVLTHTFCQMAEDPSVVHFETLCVAFHRRCEDAAERIIREGISAGGTRSLGEDILRIGALG